MAVTFFPRKVVSIWEITACTSAEQFEGMFRRMGSKYCQKFLGGLSESIIARENGTYKIASTTPEDAYPAKKSPGLLLVVLVNAVVDVMHVT